MLVFTALLSLILTLSSLNTPQVGAIETEIACGQVEQLIQQAESELELIPAYASWKAWEAPPPAANDEYFEDLYKELERRAWVFFFSAVAFFLQTRASPKTIYASRSRTFACSGWEGGGALGGAAAGGEEAAAG